MNIRQRFSQEKTPNHVSFQLIILQIPSFYQTFRSNFPYSLKRQKKQKKVYQFNKIQKNTLALTYCITLKTKYMELPKFLLGDNTDFPDDIFILHMDYPQFIVNLKNDEIELLEEVEDLSEAELQTEMSKLITEAIEFYDREMSRYEE